LGDTCEGATIVRICLVGNARAVHLQRWAEAYRDRGHDVHILSIRATEIHSITMHTRCVGPPNTTFAPFVFLSYAWLAIRARSALASIRPDVVHAHYVTTSGAIARFGGADPLVITAWGTDVVPKDGVKKNVVVRALNRYALGAARSITSASSFMADVIETTYPGVSVEVVPFGVDVGAFTPRTRPTTAPLTLGIVKSLNNKYGVDVAIRALPLIRASVPDARLVIAGEGPLRKDLGHLADQLGVGDDVRFVGRVPHADVPDLMRGFDILLNPSVVPESFGVAVLEGQAAALPVIATDVGGVAETCIDGSTCLLVEPGNPSAIAAAVAELSDPATRQLFGTTGRRHVEDRFTWDRSVDHMLGILEGARS
jgi:glycosyltransferase involved in cell wall biosynthesis